MPTTTEDRQLDMAVGVSDGRSYWRKEQGVERGTTLSELMKRPDLDFQVEKRPLAYGRPGVEDPSPLGNTVEVGPDLIMQDEFRATVRVNPDGGSAILGCVTDDYQVVQHQDTLEVAEYIIGKTGGEYEAIGTERDGRQVWAVVRMDDADRPLKLAGDLVDPFMLVTTRHDGGGAVALTTAPVRRACTNAIPFYYGIGSTQAVRGMRFRHVGDTDAKLKVAQNAIEKHAAYMREFAKLADQLALKKATPRELAEWCDALYPIEKGMGDRAVKSREEARLMVEHLATNAENLEGHHGTAWAFVNAAAEYTDWGSRRRRNQMNPLLGSRETQQKNGALRIVMHSMN